MIDNCSITCSLLDMTDRGEWWSVFKVCLKKILSESVGEQGPWRNNNFNHAHMRVFHVFECLKNFRVKCSCVCVHMWMCTPVVCARTHVWVYTYVHVHVCSCVCLCVLEELQVEVRGQPWELFPRHHSPCFFFYLLIYFETYIFLTGLELSSVLTDWPKTRILFFDRVSYWLELIKQGRHDGYWTPRDPTQYWNHNCVPLCPTLLFNKSSGESPPRPIKTFFFVCFAFKSASGLVLSVPELQ